MSPQNWRTLNFFDFQRRRWAAAPSSRVKRDPPSLGVRLIWLVWSRPPRASILNNLNITNNNMIYNNDDRVTTTTTTIIQLRLGRIKEQFILPFGGLNRSAFIRRADFHSSEKVRDYPFDLRKTVTFDSSSSRWRHDGSHSTTNIDRGTYG